MLQTIPHSRPWIESADRVAIDQTLNSHMIACGARVRDFEEAVAAQINSRLAIACTSGTSALILALKTLNIGTDDEVIIPTYVCWNVLAAVVAVGAIPRLCDVDESGVITVETVRPVINTRTRAMVAVHIFGHPCDVVSLNSLGVPIIEDACQAFGLKIGQYSAGTLGALGVFSFHATKCLTTGEGGMLVVKDLALLQQPHSISESPAFNNRAGLTAMTDIQAALGLSQLERYTYFLERRLKIFQRYHEAVAHLNRVEAGYSGYPDFLFRYTLRTDIGFEAAQSAFLSFGVQIRRGVDGLLHRRLGLDDVKFPVASGIYSGIISLPFYPSLNELEQDKVIAAMRGVFVGT